MKSQDIRESFLSYFKKQGLPALPSSPLVPQGDPTLLFTAAGMVQFKANFLGLKRNLKNAATSQKCLRTTDIDNVGFTKRHLTFFEMLGNFSFGDYFKKEAINFAWDYLTNALKIDKNKLYVSIYKGGIAPRDEEAYKIWSGLIDKSRICEFDEKDNFWTMGLTGPCGPCSEIYYDFGEQNGCPRCKDKGIACNCGRYVEIWNLVFTQFDRQEDGSLKNLPQANIDTGMGLERLCMIMQNVDNPFDTDLFEPILSRAKKLLNIAGKTPREISTLRIIADHLRASCFLIAEGILPSNDGRGYILRRLIRRAVRYGRLSGRDAAFMWELAPAVASMYRGVYPELAAHLPHISNTLKTEENSFIKTLSEGESRLQNLIARNAKEISGAEAFNLYETYGFPLELTKEILAEHKIALEEKSFYDAKSKAKEISRAEAGEFEKEKVLILQKLESELPATKFTGYENLSQTATVLALLNAKYKRVKELNCAGYIITDITPFYAEGGGQAGDIGQIVSGESAFSVLDTQKPLEKLYLHKASLVKGSIKENDKVSLTVDGITRFKTSANHTAVHVLNACLKKILGTQVHQAGSFVSPEKLRFDYTVSSAPAQEDLLAAWAMASDVIAANLKVSYETRPLSEAKELGATMLLGEKYADPARFLLINKDGFANPKDRFSLELCGGTHIKNTSEIIAIRVLKESAVSSGVRRIEAIAGLSAVDYLKEMADIAIFAARTLNVVPDEIGVKIENLQKSEKELKKEVSSLKRRLLVGADEAAREEIKTKDFILLAFNAENTESKELRAIADAMSAKNAGKAVLVSTDKDGRKSFVIKSYSGGPDAGALTKKIAALIDGKGGGKPDFAQGGGQAVAWKEFTTKINQSLI
jgi:alanyl-tRNA synthetase